MNENILLNRNEVIPPIVNFSQRALLQLKLIAENDFTLGGKYFRILVSGKGCDGFTYSAGFTDLHHDDFLITINDNKTEIIVDPFTAFYLGRTFVDYYHDIELDQEGFVIENQSHDEYKGKFWKKRPDLVPPTHEGPDLMEGR